MIVLAKLDHRGDRLGNPCRFFGERLAELGRLRGELGIERRPRHVDLALDRALEILAVDLELATDLDAVGDDIDLVAARST